MFRRKTDQVYATLQQVQRRITERSVSMPPGAQPQADARPATQPLYPFDQDEKKAEETPAPEEQPALPAKRLALHLSTELASTLAVLWLLTIVIAYFVGTSHARQPEASAGYAAGPAGQRDPERTAPATAPNAATPPSTDPAGFVMPGSGKDVIVIQSVPPKNSEEAEQQFADQAKKLNEWAKKNAEHGYRPWFGVRKPSSGGLQLVFGALDGKFGVDRDNFPELAKQIDGQPGYDGVHWITVSDR